jgi:hypothetical protein
MVDIDTSMPVIVKPIMSTEQISLQEMQIAGEATAASTNINFDLGGGQVLACLEVINKMGVVGRAVRNKANVDPIDGEMLDLFEK